jgi:hypothetical protein
MRAIVVRLEAIDRDLDERGQQRMRLIRSVKNGRVVGKRPGVRLAPGP